MAETKSCCHGERKTQRDDEQKKKLLNRLKRIEGQIRGIQTMIENDVLQQSAAVTAAINGFNRELLGNHIKGCVCQDIRDGKEEVVDELLATIHKLMK